MAKKKPIVTNAMRQLTAAKVGFEAIEYETDGVIEDNFGMLISEKTGIPPEKSFKTLVSKECRKTIWQRSYYDHIIRNEADYIEKSDYIINNPAKWAEDEYFTEG